MKTTKPHTIDWPQIERFLESADKKADKKLVSARKILEFGGLACGNFIASRSRP